MEQAKSISETDKLVLELLKMKKILAMSQVEKAVAQQETAEIALRHTVLQIYMKYGLSEVDIIDDSGNIIYGGALNQQENK